MVDLSFLHGFSSSSPLWQRTVDNMYCILNTSADLAAPGADCFPRLIVFARIQFVVEFSFYTTLLAANLFVLFVFRRPGQRVHGQQYI